jgi:hypothetical protein
LADVQSLPPNRYGVANGQDISWLRKDQGLREIAQERMQSVKVVLDTLLENAPARQIVLREWIRT